MTRINLVPPASLSRQHLLAEYRELPRVFGLVRRRQEAGHTPADCNIPEAYCLGPGHVTFFYDKLSWLIDRQILLIAEMDKRGYQANHRDPGILASGLDRHWFGFYFPTPEAIALNKARIAERGG